MPRHGHPGGTMLPQKQLWPVARPAIRPGMPAGGGAARQRLAAPACNLARDCGLPRSLKKELFARNMTCIQD